MKAVFVLLSLVLSVNVFARSQRVWSCFGYDIENSAYSRFNVSYNDVNSTYSVDFLEGQYSEVVTKVFDEIVAYKFADDTQVFTSDTIEGEVNFELTIDNDYAFDYFHRKIYTAYVDMQFLKHDQTTYDLKLRLGCIKGMW